MKKDTAAAMIVMILKLLHEDFSKQLKEEEGFDTNTLGGKLLAS